MIALGKILKTILTTQSFDAYFVENSNLLLETDRFGRTILIYSCIFDRVNIVKWLIKHGADIDLADKLKRTALHWAVYKVRPFASLYSSSVLSQIHSYPYLRV